MSASTISTRVQLLLRDFGEELLELTEPGTEEGQQQAVSFVCTCYGLLVAAGGQRCNR
jgi:hypothetical protein